VYNFLLYILVFCIFPFFVLYWFYLRTSDAFVNKIIVKLSLTYASYNLKLTSVSESYNGRKAKAERTEEKKSGQRSEESDRHRHNEDQTEFWGYVDVRPGAHMFYWLYLTTHAPGFIHRPLIIWLQVRLATFERRPSSSCKILFLSIIICSQL